jgi:hypothetical protein
LKEVERYTKAADQQRLAQAAMARQQQGGMGQRTIARRLIGEAGLTP